MGSSFWFNTINWDSPLYIFMGCHNRQFNKILFFLSNNILFTFTNSVDPDEIQHYAAFHLSLHCLQKYPFRVSRIQKVNVYIFVWSFKVYYVLLQFSYL